MIRYWWVNHRKTSREEISGGYLWSPQAEAGGKRSQFYDNMLLASPGDRVLSYARGEIGHVGTVQGPAMVAYKPMSFRSIDTNWADTGWLLPVDWTSLSKPVIPKDHLPMLAPLLPDKYSPLVRSSGKGSQKAYFTEISREVFSVLVPSVFRFSEGSVTSASELVIKIDDELQSSICSDESIDATTKRQLVLSRYGQGKFRSRVLERYEACVLTGVSTPSLLVASHIKPWRACASSRERLDGDNGLLLAPHVDRLFDSGLLTFDDEGVVFFSSSISLDELGRLGVSSIQSKSRSEFSLATRAYLDFHRKNVFRP